MDWGSKVKFHYLVGQAKKPQPSLGGGVQRARPIIPIRVFGPGGDWLLDGQLDTAADDTVFPNWLAPLIGLDLLPVPEHDITLVGRPIPVRCRFLPVTFRLTDGSPEVYEWSAIVGFAPVPLRRALLGQTGFLQFFDSQFLGADREVIIDPNWSFSGKRN